MYVCMYVCISVDTGKIKCINIGVSVVRLNTL